MIPIHDFIKSIVPRPESESALRAILQDAGYYSYYVCQHGYSYYMKCQEWCKENYPNDYAYLTAYMFFTDKEIAMIMKLSVL